jgi:hypothetical protein
LLLADIKMPVVMDGIALALAAAPRSSGSRDDADDWLCGPARARLRSGALIHDVLTKPFARRIAPGSWRGIGSAATGRTVY